MISMEYLLYTYLCANFTKDLHNVYAYFFDYEQVEDILRNKDIHHRLELAKMCLSQRSSNKVNDIALKDLSDIIFILEESIDYFNNKRECYFFDFNYYRRKSQLINIVDIFNKRLDVALITN